MSKRGDERVNSDEPGPDDATLQRAHEKRLAAGDAWVDILGERPAFRAKSPLEAALQPAPADWRGLALVGAVALYALVLVVSDRLAIHRDLTQLGFQDVVDAMPPFGVYMQIVLCISLALATLIAIFWAFYWPVRVARNQCPGYMSSTDLRYVSRDAGFIFSLILLVGIWIYEWFFE